VAGLDQEQAQGLDKGGFADAGRAGDTEAYGPAAFRQHLFQQVFGLGPVIGTGGFDQGNGLGQHPPVAG